MGFGGGDDWFVAGLRRLTDLRLVAMSRTSPKGNLRVANASDEYTAQVRGVTIREP
jgi:hypothetical protein